MDILTKEDKKNTKTIFDLFFSDFTISKELKEKYKKEFNTTYLKIESDLYTNYKIIGG